MAHLAVQHRALRTGQVTRAVLTNRSAAGARGQPIGEQWSAGVRLPRSELLSTDSTHTLHARHGTDGTPLNKYLILGKSSQPGHNGEGGLQPKLDCGISLFDCPEKLHRDETRVIVPFKPPPLAAPRHNDGGLLLIK